MRVSGSAFVDHRRLESEGALVVAPAEGRPSFTERWNRKARSWSRQRKRVRRSRQVGFHNERTAVPGSAVAPALALEGPPGAGVQVGEAKGRQVVSARELRSVVRGHAAARSVVQGVSGWASMPRKKGC